MVLHPNRIAQLWLLGHSRRTGQKNAMLVNYKPPNLQPLPCWQRHQKTWKARTKHQRPVSAGSTSRRDHTAMASRSHPEGDKILPMPVSIDREDLITALLECNVLLEANLLAKLNAIAAWQQQASAFNTFACAMREHTAEMVKWHHERKLENDCNTKFWDHNVVAFNRAMKGMLEATNPRS